MAQISVVRKSELEGAMRLDAEYYQPKYFHNEALIETGSFIKCTLGELIYPVKNGFDYRDFAEIGRPYIRVGDVLFGEANYRDAVKVNISSDSIEKDVAVKVGDILFSRKGTFGRSAVVEKAFENCVISSEIMRIRIKDKRVDPYYLSTYLNCRIGFLQVERRTHGVSNYSISQQDLMDIKVAILPRESQLGIAGLVKEAYLEKERSYALYLQAEQLLLDELGFKELNLSHELYYTVPFKKTREANRLDAEHFQPRCERLLQHLASTGKSDLLGNLVVAQPIKRGLQPTYVESGEVIVVNSKYVGKQFVNIEPAERTDLEFWQVNKRAQATKYDVIMNSTGWGTIGRANCILHDEKTVVDNHVTTIRSDKQRCNPVYLAVFLNSKVGQIQTEKWLSGSSGQIEIYPSDIGQYVVYLPSGDSQKKIAELVTRSWEARQKARQLLEGAKHKVEAIIEGQSS
jgi:restriction endonuclease S subunit